MGELLLCFKQKTAYERRISDWSSDVVSSDLTSLQVAMFSLCSAAASAPGSPLATVAQIIPFSSPLAMAARAATDDARGVHLLALGWQAIWVALVIMLSVRLFRAGVLSGRSNWKFWKRGTGAATAAAEIGRAHV